MAKVIYKYAEGEHGFFLPPGAKVLSVQRQQNQLTLWAEVDPNHDPAVEPLRQVEPKAVLTGGSVDDLTGWTYFGTTQSGHETGFVFVEHYYLDLRGLP